MRTTFHINDQLYRAAKAMAARSHRTLTDLVEEGLRRVTSGEKKHQGPPPGFRMPQAGGEGLLPGVDPQLKVSELEELSDIETYRR